MLDYSGTGITLLYEDNDYTIDDIYSSQGIDETGLIPTTIHT